MILDVPVEKRDRVILYAQIEAFKNDFPSPNEWLSSRGINAVDLYSEMPEDWTAV
jgi:hypothetical protein